VVVKAVTCWVILSGDNTLASKVSNDFNNSEGVQWGFAITAFRVSVGEQEVLGTKEDGRHVIEEQSAKRVKRVLLKTNIIQQDTGHRRGTYI
jgi:hypothetical protein